MSTALTTETKTQSLATVGDTALSENHEQSTSSQSMAARAEIESAIIVAKKFPRDEDQCFEKLLKSCKRFAFAAVAKYSYPRGGETVSGPSVNLARELARIWGNIRYGADVIYDSDDERTVRCWAWDVESNTKETQDINFRKLIFRKKGGWQKPDERDLRELTNRQSAISVRNCLLHLLPRDMIDDALEMCRKTLEGNIKENIDDHRKKIIAAFQSIGVSVGQLEEYLDHPLRSCGPAEIATLREVYVSIKDGNSKWKEYQSKKEGDDGKDAEAKTVTMDDLVSPPSDGDEYSDKLRKELEASLKRVRTMDGVEQKRCDFHKLAKDIDDADIIDLVCNNKLKEIETEAKS